MEKVKDILQKILENGDGELQNETQSLKADYKACLDKLNLQENKIREHGALIESLSQSSVSAERIVQMETMVNELAFFHRKPQPGRRD